MTTQSKWRCTLLITRPIILNLQYLRLCASLHLGWRTPSNITSVSTRSTPTPAMGSQKCTVTNRSIQRRCSSTIFNNFLINTHRKVLDDGGVLDIRAIITFKGKVGEILKIVYCQASGLWQYNVCSEKGEAVTVHSGCLGLNVVRKEGTKDCELLLC